MEVCEALNINYHELSQKTAENLRALDPNNYRISYWPFVDLFSNYAQTDNRSSLIAAAHAVYGWMPCILKSVQLNDAICEFLYELRNSECPLQVIENLNEEQKGSYLRFVNGSVIGTSKFLHFLIPNFAPIWDRRVGKHFSLNYNQVNSIENYLKYWKALANCKLDVPNNFAIFCTINNRRPTDIRLKEYALFLITPDQ